MKVKEFAEALDLTAATGAVGMDREVSGCYIGDLLSWVMSKASKGDAWITIMSNINIVAVCSLTEAACVILCEGVTADEVSVQKAAEQEIPILLSDKTAYELALEVGKVI